MSKKTKTLIWIASALIVIGILLWIGVLSMARGYLTNLTTEVYQTKTYEISDAFAHISITTGTANVEFKPAEDGKCKVVCYDTEKLCHTAKVENNTLTIQVNDNRKWYDYISINLVQPTITVYLPGDAYGALTVETDTGEVYVPKNFEFESMDIAGDTGYVLICASVKGSVRIHTDTGNISIDGISAGNLDLSTTTGYIFVEQTETGDIKADVSTGMVRVSDTRCANLFSQGDTGFVLLENAIVETDGAETLFQRYPEARQIAENSGCDTELYK